MKFTKSITSCAYQMWIWSHREVLWVIEIFLVYQNSLQLKLEVKNFKPEVVLEKHFPIL